MGKIIAMTNLTLDGVMQAPGSVDEDPRDGFQYGGWAAPYGAMQQPEAGVVFSNLGALLFGRVTYDRFYAFWPNQKDNNPFTDFLNNIPKYVVSSTLQEPLGWMNSTLIKTDIAGTLSKLKASQEKDFLIFGSGVLIQSLATWNLIDEYMLLIHPLTLGTGRRLFAEGGPQMNLKLHDSKTTANGIVVATYHPMISRS